MKKSIRLLLPLCSLILIQACNDDDPVPVPSPTPEPQKHPVEQTLTGNYWNEKICFTYLPVTSESVPIQVSEDIVEDFYWTGGYYYNRRLDVFTVDPETGKLHAYDLHSMYIGNWYYQNRYWIEYPDPTHIRIRAKEELSAYVGAAFDIELTVVSCDENQIVLDGPIKPYIWQNWMLDLVAQRENVMFLGIRVYWTRIEDGAETLEPSNPID